MRLGARKGVKGAVRVPKILVLASGLLHARRMAGIRMALPTTERELRLHATAVVTRASAHAPKIVVRITLFRYPETLTRLIEAAPFAMEQRTIHSRGGVEPVQYPGHAGSSESRNGTETG